MLLSAPSLSFVFVALAAAAPTTPAATPAPAATSYQGLGAESVAPAVLEKFRAGPLAPEVTRKVQAMLDVRAPTAGLVSPDGKRLFFTWAVTGVRQVWRLDKPMGFPVQLTGGEDATSVVEVTPDGARLVIQRDAKGEENPGLYVMSAEGGPLQVIQHKPKVQTQFLFLSDDGAALYFRDNATRPDAYAIRRYDLKTQTIETVFDGAGDAALWNASDLRPGFLLVTRDVGARMNEVFEFDLKTKVLSPLLGQGEREDYVVRYGRGDDVLVLTPKLGDARRLYRFDRKARALVAISPEQRWDIAGIDIDHARTRIVASVNEAGFTRAAAFDARTLKAIPLPAFKKADHIMLGASTRDGRFTTVTVDPGTAPQESFVLDWRTKKLFAWHVPSAPEVDLASFVPVSLESYPARDGTPIPAFVRRPARCATTLCPVIVDFHGGPEAQTRAGFSTRAQLFVDAGFIYVQPNVRGSDGYGKAWVHADDGPKRKQIITDIEDAGRWARATFARDGKTPKVGIFGGSYGGYSALVGMTMFAGTYDAGISVVGISSLLSFLENTAPYRRALRVSEYGDPVVDRAALLELSPITHVNKTRGPLLIIQGATDPRVPVGESIQMFEALDKKGTKPKLILFPDEGHGVQKRENSVVLLGHALAFFDEHLR